MSKSAEYKGRTFSVGDRLKVISDMEGGKPGLCRGDTITVAALEVKTGESPHIGVMNERPMSGWHDLSGMVKKGRGWWVPISRIHTSTIRLEREKLVVEQGFSFKGRSLAGKACKRLVQLEDGVSLVEFEENIGGGGGDGLGKRGRCVVVPNTKLKEMKQKGGV